MFSSLRKRISHPKNGSKEKGSGLSFYWDRLPLEMRSEILKGTDLQTRFRIRRLSKTDKALVDRTDFIIPFINLYTDENTLSVTVCEAPEKVFVLTVKKHKTFWRKAYHVSRAHSLEQTNSSNQVRRKESAMKIMSSLLEMLSAPNVTIEKINVEMTWPHDIFIDFLVENFNLKGSKRATVIMTSANESLEILRPYVSNMFPIQTFRIFDHRELPEDSEDLRVFSGKEFGSPPNHTGTVSFLYMRSSVLQGGLKCLIVGAIGSLRGGMEYYCIPHYQPTNPRDFLSQFGGEVIETEDKYIQKITLTQLEAVHVTITKCGTFVEKVRREQLETGSSNRVSSKEFQKSGCSLGWMCANCDKTTESWYFRHIMKTGRPSGS